MLLKNLKHIANMNYKIQCQTMMGWMNLMGEFETIQKAQDKIPWLQSMVKDGGEEILRIVESNEEGIGFYIYENT